MEEDKKLKLITNKSEIKQHFLGSQDVIFDIDCPDDKLFLMISDGVLNRYIEIRDYKLITNEDVID